MIDTEIGELERCLPRLSRPERFAAMQKLEWFALMAARPDWLEAGAAVC